MSKTSAGFEISEELMKAKKQEENVMEHVLRLKNL